MLSKPNHTIPCLTKSVKPSKFSVKKIQRTIKYNCPHAYKNTPFTINLDWLQLNGTLPLDESTIIANYEQGYFNLLNYTFKIESGTLHFKHRLFVFKNDTHLFTIETHPRNGKHDCHTCLIKFENHLLYKDWYVEYIELKKTIDFELHKFSRVDIALDGINLVELMNDYQQNKTQDIRLLGKSTIRAFGLNKRTKRFLSYTVGSKRGEKIISMYNKSQDIDRTNKIYIREVWHKAGLRTENEKKSPIYRYELRLKNSWIKLLTINEKHEYEILNKTEKQTRKNIIDNNTPDLFLAKLTNGNTLLQLLHVGSDSLFEWVYQDDKNTTRCTRVQLLPKCVRNIYKSNRSTNGLAYKAKMSLHHHVKESIRGKINYQHALESMRETLNAYELNLYYGHKITEWIAKYKRTLVIDTEDKKKRLNDCIYNLLNINKIVAQI